jgi:hypothetical protein
MQKINNLIDICFNINNNREIMETLYSNKGNK